ncbi:MAG TPA: zf-HC2 domain-containing protein [Casimicrobiaceae bacterium]|nr:zf-HC2 domain-containing protein [Casimicrobiaceae bacterium]
MPTLHSITHMISCQEASRLLSQRQDRQLRFWERLRLRAHLGLCDICTRFAKQLDFMREALHRYRD